MNVLANRIHFISGLPRSGSTLLAALLRQNPRFYGAMTSPVGGLMNRMLEAMSEDNEFSVFLSPEQKKNILFNVFSGYYQEQIEQYPIIFDTNRLWCSKLSLIHQLFPHAKIICCVRNIAWIMDSLERLVRQNAFEVSRLFNNKNETATVYSRTEALTQGNRLVGFAYNALKEAFYSEQANKLLLVDYELLTTGPAQTLSLIYQFLGEKPFEHDFKDVQYNESRFDQNLRTKGLHQIRQKVEFKPRKTILPPDLFERFSQLSFWTTATDSLAHVICIQTQTNSDQKQIVVS
ncbi:MAG: sulfotransferase [Microcoleaceae cyanobacterium]